MKTYVMMFAVANMISGAPIYGSNKINFLKENGWNVVLFPVNTGEIYIKDLKEYENECYSFLCKNPWHFSNKMVDKFLNQLIKKINLDSEKIIIETGTDFTAYWGELLAEKINAKHMIFLLDEYNERINENVIDFWLFKHSRKELFCITPEISKKYLEKFKKIEENECYSFNAYCSNSVKDYESEYSNLIEKGDYTIGTVGRLDKIFVNEIINNVCNFAEENQNKTISFCLFGGADKKIISKIENQLKKHTNIKVFISGYLWPLPLNGLKKCDLFISGAGSAKVTANLNIPTISMDVITSRPVGFVEDRNKQYLTSDNNNEHTLKEYMDKVLLEGYKVDVINRVSIDSFWDMICDEFNKQLDECMNPNVKQEYYDFGKIKKVQKIQNKIYKILVSIIGYNNTEKMRFAYCKILKK